MNVIVSRLDLLFEGKITDNNTLFYTNIAKYKLMELETLATHAANNSKEQFTNSPDLEKEMVDAVCITMETQTSMNRQALNLELASQGTVEILLNRERALRSVE